MYKELLFDVQDSIATITLNRPKVYNAFNDNLSYELIDALRKCKKDDGIRAIVITGSGEKAFCSGQDLKDAASRPNRSIMHSVEHRYNPMIRLIRGTEKPFICRLNGIAAGAGASLAIACDYVIASERAKLVWAFVNIGLVLDSGSAYFLPRLVGARKAFELSTLGNKITAAEALELGMVNEVVPHEELDARVTAMAKRYATSATKAIGLMKRMLNRSSYSTLEDMLEQEMYCQAIAGSSEDNREGIMAFVQKRKPNFKGK